MSDRFIPWRDRVHQIFPRVTDFILNAMERQVRSYGGFHPQGEDAERLAMLWLKKRGFHVWRSVSGSLADIKYKTDILAFNPQADEVWVVQVKAGFGLVGWVEYPSTRWIEKTHPNVKRVFMSVNPDNGDVHVWIDGEEEIVDQVKEVVFYEKV